MVQNGGIMHSTLNPNEMKCGYCGWEKIEIDLKDYCAVRGYVGPPP